MQVSEVMHKGVSTVQIHDSIKHVAALMKREDIGAVPVYKNERPVGFVTDRDIVISCVAQGHGVDDPISHAMSKDLFFVYEHDNVSVAMDLMSKNQLSRLLVVDAGKRPVGMISLQDISNRQGADNLSHVISNLKK